MKLGAIEKSTGKYVYPFLGKKNTKYDCPDCGKSLEFCHGNVYRPYFRHKNDKNRTCFYYDQPNESQIHKDAKLLMQRLLEDRVDITIFRSCNNCDHKETFLLPKLETSSKILLEYYYDDTSRKRADLAHVKQSNQLVYIIEICHTNQTKERPEPWYEIEASSFIKLVYNEAHLKASLETPLNNSTFLNLKCVRNNSCIKCIEEKKLWIRRINEKIEREEIAKQEREKEKIEREKKELEIKKTKIQETIKLLEENNIPYTPHTPDQALISNSYTNESILFDLHKRTMQLNTFECSEGYIPHSGHQPIIIERIARWLQSSKKLICVCLLCDHRTNILCVDLFHINLCVSCDVLYLNSPKHDKRPGFLGGAFKDELYERWKIERKYREKFSKWEIDDDWEIIKICLNNKWFSADIRRCIYCEYISVDGVCKNCGKQNIYIGDCNSTYNREKSHPTEIEDGLKNHNEASQHVLRSEASQHVYIKKISEKWNRIKKSTEEKLLYYQCKKCQNLSNIEMELYNKETPIIHGAKRGLLKECSNLLKHEADVNKKDIQGYTVLTHAVEQNNIELVKLLPLYKFNNLRQPLLLAIKNGYKEIVQLLFTQELKSMKDKYKTPLLIMMVKLRKLESIKILTEMNINIDEQDMEGRTALMTLLIPPHSKHYKKLSYSDIADQLKYNETPQQLFFNAFHKNYDNSYWLEAEDTKEYKLIYNDIFEILMKSRPKLDIQDAYGYTALMYAAQYHNYSCVQELIKLQPNLNIKNADGENALTLSVCINNTNVALNLIDTYVNSGFDINYQNIKGETILMMAIRSENIDITRKILHFKPNPNIRNGDGKSALHIAVDKNNVGITKLLISERSYLKFQDNIGQTALMIAVRGKNKKLINLLCKSGADVNISDKDGNTALMMLIKPKCISLIRILKKAGARLDIINNQGNDAKDLIFKGNRKDIMKEFNLQDSDFCIRQNKRAKLDPTENPVKSVVSDNSNKIFKPIMIWG